MSENECKCMDRRQLITSCLAMAGLPGFCCTTEELPAAAFKVAGQSLIIDLAKASPLRKPGGAVKVIDHERKLNLIVVRPAKDRFAALDRSCTHGGAQVIYNRDHRTVVCTSWGHSEFALDGAVLGGSAKTPLRTYPVRFAGNRLEIDLGVKS